MCADVKAEKVMQQHFGIEKNSFLLFFEVFTGENKDSVSDIGMFEPL